MWAAERDRERGVEICAICTKESSKHLFNDLVAVEGLTACRMDQPTHNFGLGGVKLGSLFGTGDNGHTSNSRTNIMAGWPATPRLTLLTVRVVICFLEFEYSKHAIDRRNQKKWSIQPVWLCRNSNIKKMSRRKTKNSICGGVSGAICVLFKSKAIGSVCVCVVGAVETRVDRTFLFSFFFCEQLRKVWKRKLILSLLSFVYNK